VNKNLVSWIAASTVFSALAFSSVCLAQDASKIELSDGKLIMQAPKEWKKVQPKSRIVEFEFVAPADAKATEDTARVTIMGAGGSVEANIDRWYGQFEQPDGKATKDKAKNEKFEVGSETVYWVDVTGTFKDTMGAGPFSGAKPVLRENYRMLGAIVVGKQGQYFIKLTGKNDVVEKLVDGFKKMLKELETK
jgi:hypothetical protein